MTHKRTITLLITAVTLLSLLLAACASRTAVETPSVEKARETVVVTEIVEVVVTPTPEPEDRKLEVFHWWTAGGEQEAAEAMFEALHDKHPEIQIIENPVSGGGGVSHRQVLQARLSARIPPDTWQTLGGAELKSYVDEDYLEPLDALWADLDYDNVVPKPLANALTVDGHPYVVPLNMHIQNILYYNKPLFDAAGLEPPENFDTLIEVAESLKQLNPEMAPFALGSKEKWEAAFILDSILLELGGPEYYVDLYKGNIDVNTDETFRTALEKLEQLSPYIYPFHPNLTWDQSCRLLISEESAMVLMGTWAIGYSQSRDWTPGVEFSAVTFPQEPERILLFHPDTFGLAKAAPHPETTVDWLKVVASPELQIATDVIQGGLFARIDIDPGEFPDPIRQELQAYVRDNPSNLILDQHGSIAPFDFTQAYWVVIADFLVKPDIDGTIETVAELFETYNVKQASAWYQWP